jgi:hypothetical protein
MKSSKVSERRRRWDVGECPIPREGTRQVHARPSLLARPLDGPPLCRSIGEGVQSLQKRGHHSTRVLFKKKSKTRTGPLDQTPSLTQWDPSSTAPPAPPAPTRRTWWIAFGTICRKQTTPALSARCTKWLPDKCVFFWLWHEVCVFTRFSPACGVEGDKVDLAIPKTRGSRAMASTTVEARLADAEAELAFLRANEKRLARLSALWLHGHIPWPLETPVDATRMERVSRPRNPSDTPGSGGNPSKARMVAKQQSMTAGTVHVTASMVLVTKQPYGRAEENSHLKARCERLSIELLEGKTYAVCVHVFFGLINHLCFVESSRVAKCYKVTHTHTRPSPTRSPALPPPSPPPVLFPPVSFETHPLTSWRLEVKKKP